jgi:hypothetical protein
VFVNRDPSPYIVEAVLGLVIALLLLWVAIAAVTDVPFVYQGL